MKVFCFTVYTKNKNRVLFPVLEKGHTSIKKPFSFCMTKAFFKRRIRKRLEKIKVLLQNISSGIQKNKVLFPVLEKG